MREAISIAAILIAFVYFIAFAAAVMAGLEREMHWAIALLAFAGFILLRLWPALPFLAWYGADRVFGWPWWLAILLAAPVCIYIVSYYWTRLTDYFRRPIQKQGA